MKKLRCYICDKCRTVILDLVNGLPPYRRKGKKRMLDFCSSECLSKEQKKQKKLSP